MAYHTLPQQAHLRQCLQYHHESGRLIWQQRPENHFSADHKWRAWNRQLAGKPAGWRGSDGYVYVKIDGLQYAAHRVIWMLCTGTEPPHVIDHINGDPADNRLCNLRPATFSENRRNRELPGDAGSLPGVSRRGDKFRALVYLQSGKRVSVGDYATAELAYAACQGARRLYHRIYGDKWTRVP